MNFVRSFPLRFWGACCLVVWSVTQCTTVWIRLEKSERQTLWLAVGLEADCPPSNRKKCVSLGPGGPVLHRISMKVT